MTITEFINLVANGCFPVVVCAFLLIRLEKQINKLSSSVNLLSTIVSTKLGVVINEVEEIIKEDKKWKKKVPHFTLCLHFTI